MKVTVIDVAGVAPERVFNEPGAHVSADGAWTLATSGCREPGMAQPVRCDGIIRRNVDGHEWAVGRITRSTTFQPWIGQRTRVAWSRKGRIIIGDPVTGSIVRSDSLKRLEPHVILGHPHLDRLLIAGLRTVALLDHEGHLITESRYGRYEHPLIGGVSSDSKLYLQLVQPGPHQPATLQGFDADTGEPDASIDAASIHELIDQAIAATWPAKHYTDSARRTLWGGWWLGRVGVTAHPDDQTMTLDVRIPTGETCELFGKNAALVNQHWIRIRVEA